MKRIIIGTLLFIIGAAGTQEAEAQPFGAPGIRHEQMNEQRRIHEGMASGELTRREARHLEMQQDKIRHDKRCAKADGVITPCERRGIKEEQLRASRNIYMQKHDGQRRF